MIDTSIGNLNETRERKNTPLPDVVQRLQTLIDGLARFLEGQFGRLESTIDECERVLSLQSELEQRERQLHDDRQNWQQQKDLQQQDILAERDRLIESWKTLEEEQRGALANGIPAPVGMSASPFVVAGPAIPPTTTPAANENIHVEPPAQPPATNPNPPSGNTAFDQFQRMKREIRAHSQRTRNQTR